MVLQKMDILKNQLKGILIDNENSFHQIQHKTDE